MFKKMEVLKILLLVACYFGLYDKLSASKQMLNFVACNFSVAIVFVLVILKNYNNEKFELFDFTMVIIVLLHYGLMTHFYTMRRKIEKLSIDIKTILIEIDTNIFLEAAEKRMAKIFDWIVVILSFQLISFVVNLLSGNDAIIPLYKPKSWETDKLLVPFLYGLVEFMCIASTNLVLMTMNFISICLFIYLHELSKLICQKFERMKTTSELENCVNLHLNFIRFEIRQCIFHLIFQFFQLVERF